MTKLYKLGLILGRFQIFHKGHEYIINEALKSCDELLILIGSSDKKGTFKNPFDFETRKNNILKIYSQNNIHIFPLPDLGVGNVPSWGDYVIKSAIKLYNKPDLIVYGKEDKCDTWYNNYPEIEKEEILRNKIKINSTLLKDAIINNNDIKDYISSSLIDFYQRNRNYLINLKNNELNQ